MTDNVVNFDGVTRLDISAEKVLEQANQSSLENAVVIGYDTNGELYFASSFADGGDVLWLLERAKLQLFETAKELEE